MGPENISKEEILEKIEASHQARISGNSLSNLMQGNVEFQEVMPEALNRDTLIYGDQMEEESVEEPARMGQLQDYDGNYVALLEQMRHVYSSSGTSSWSSHDHCGNHYDNCGCYPKPQDCCYDYTCTSWGNNNNCCSTQEICDQLCRIECMIKEIYLTNQQLYNCILDYYNKFVTCKPC